ncbi:MAG TPA: tetratricopeptide repeat protein [Hypericibacter adhaerens]|jgi:tetratricopeptide (TPR) repeat protein|uniref:tetratricopeptide repeat protein n=1 Tax=Hypericibacter adhaerens TaxID=2602016 RepID=UPI002B7AFD74|nr:tetratricopeptide repeat protein [Hypericibacter adhaerens]HWA42803.1 tetratricopeptide repeat protein [Hypericibacter adhaerens]
MTTGSWLRRLWGAQRWAAGLGLAVALAAANPAGAFADQKDPRLPELFDLLKKAPDPGSAQQVEQLIWALWFHSDDPEVVKTMNTGVTAMSQSNFQRAIEAFHHVTEIAPDFAEGWNKLATVHYLVGDYQDSLDEIGHTLELEPRHFGALSGLGLVQAQLDHTEQALDAFERALDVYPMMQGARINAETLRKELQDKGI